MLTSLAVLGFAWKVFKMQSGSQKLSSVCLVVFRVIVGFLGQAFPFRHTRWFHVMVLQVFIFTVLILGNVYQSLVISLLALSRNGTRMLTVDMMLASDFNHLADNMFCLNMKTFLANSSIVTNIRCDKSFYNP